MEEGVSERERVCVCVCLCVLHVVSLFEEVLNRVVSNSTHFSITLTGTGTGHSPIYTVIIRFP